jgi:hypothetical protein
MRQKKREKYAIFPNKENKEVISLDKVFYKNFIVLEKHDRGAIK